MFDDYDFPNAIEMEKQLLSAMLMKEGLVVPDVAAILEADDLYRPEHKLTRCEGQKIKDLMWLD